MLLKTLFYHWFLPNEQAFINTFGDNEARQNAARSFVRSLSNCDSLLFWSCLGVTIITCVLYYTWYNNTVKPFGYHYRKSHWATWLGIALLLTFVVAFCCMSTLKNVNLDGTASFIWGFYFGNAIYCFVCFIIVSMIWCNYLPTNAYRWFKI